MHKTYTAEIRNKALDYYFDHEVTMQETCERFGIGLGAMYSWIAARTCYDRRCTDLYPCLAARKRSKISFSCSALDDTDFGGGECPFYKCE